jgi:hypothetical protein
MNSILDKYLSINIEHARSQGILTHYTYIYTAHALSPKGSKGIADIPPRHPRFTKVT